MMDWIQADLEALPIPTLPGSSLSVYYDNLTDPCALGRAPTGSDSSAADGEWDAGINGGLKDCLAEHDGDGGGEVGGDVDSANDGGGSTPPNDHDDDDDALVVDRPSRTGPDEGDGGDDGVPMDEFGFLALRDTGLEDALNLKEPPPCFDETGLSTYKELCRSMGLKPIRRFARQLHEGVVDLKFYGVSSRTLRAVAQALMYNPSVHTLDLAGNWLSAEAAFYMAELLLRENVALAHLVLRGCRLDARAAELLAEGIELNHSLEVLDLADNQIGDDGIRALQDALAQNDKLRELDLSNNHLGAAAAASLAKSLLENQTIEVLRLARNSLYEDVPKGLGALLRALHQREKSLHSLDLAWNALNMPSAVPLRAFLVRGKVQELFLDHNRLSGPAIDTIKIGVRKSSTLQHLKMGFNPMEAESAMNLLQACQNSATIKILDLNGIRVQPNFIHLMTHLINSKDISVIIEGTLSDYEVNGPNLAEMMLKRARYEGLKPKKKKRKKDFGHLLLQMVADGNSTIPPQQFTDAAQKLKKLKVRVELLRALCEEFQVKKTRVDVQAMLDCYMQLFPDTILPPPRPKKKKRKGKKRKQRKKKTIEKSEF